MHSACEWETIPQHLAAMRMVNFKLTCFRIFIRSQAVRTDRAVGSLKSTPRIVRCSVFRVSAQRPRRGNCLALEGLWLGGWICHGHGAGGLDGWCVRNYVLPLPLPLPPDWMCSTRPRQGGAYSEPRTLPVKSATLHGPVCRRGGDGPLRGSDSDRGVCGSRGLLCLSPVVVPIAVPLWLLGRSLSPHRRLQRRWTWWSRQTRWGPSDIAFPSTAPSNPPLHLRLYPRLSVATGFLRCIWLGSCRRGGRLIPLCRDEQLVS